MNQSLKFFELMAMTSGLLNVYLAARASIWNWFFGIISVCLYFFIFFNVKLYADMSLQLLFLVLQFYGLYHWLQGNNGKRILVITHINKPNLFIACTALPVIFLVIAFILKNYTDSSTVNIDALVTTLSLIAQWMMNKKWLENWLIWIGIDVISIEMYANKGLYMTSILYAIFFFIGIYGYIHWKKNVHQQYRKNLLYAA